MRYAGNDWVVDSAEYWLERAGERVDLEPQAFDLLVHMLRNRDVMLSKPDLLEAVWGDQFVSESALTTRIKQVRYALGDDGRTQRTIQTVHGRGYRFVEPVVELSPQTVEPDDRSGDASADDTLAVRHNIAPARSRVIGRAALIAQIVDVTRRERIGTLLGLGGIGKTTVAREVGRIVADGFADGAWFVDLVPVHDANELRAAIAAEIGVTLRDGTAGELIDKLRTRKLCLILDNCEHIVEDVADVVGALLDNTEHVTVLTTSRVPLGVAGEHRIAVPPLSISDREGSAVELLNEIARRRGTAIDGYDQVAAINLCRRLDGLPLALELVGGHLGAMSVFDVLKRVDGLVERTSRDPRPDRQASLAIVLDDAIDALTQSEFTLLSALAHVEGTIEFDDIEHLANSSGIDDAIGATDALVERSLLVPGDAPGTHRMLEMVRERARARDSDEHASRAIHAEWCLGVLGARWITHFVDMEMARWAELRYGDLVVAERFLRQVGRHDDAATLLAACGLAMHFDSGVRSARWLDLMGPHFETVTDPTLQAQLRCAGVMAAMSSRRHREMFDHGEAAVMAADESGDAALRALARVMRSWAGVIIDIEGALRDVDDAIDLARSVDAEPIALLAMGYKVFHLAMAARFDDAVTLANEAYREGFVESTYPVRVISLGIVCCLTIDDPERAIAIDNEVRTRLNTQGMWGMDVVRACLRASSGAIDRAQADTAAIADRLVREGLEPLPDLLLVPAVLAVVRGDHDRAARYLGAIRHADRRTQNLMASTTYRVVRSHVDPAPRDEVAGRVDEIWAEAQHWLASIATNSHSS